MNLRQQFKQKVLDLAFTAEKALHRFRQEHSQNPAPMVKKKERPVDPETGQIKTNYNNAKEERKLH